MITKLIIALLLCMGYMYAEGGAGESFDKPTHVDNTQDSNPTFNAFIEILKQQDTSGFKSQIWRKNPIKPKASQAKQDNGTTIPVIIKVGPKQTQTNSIDDTKTIVLNCKVGKTGIHMKGIGHNNYEFVFALDINGIDLQDKSYEAYNENYGITIGATFWDYYENNNNPTTGLGSDSSAHKPKLNAKTKAKLYLEALTSVVENLVTINHLNIGLILNGIEKHIQDQKGQNPNLFHEIYEIYNTQITAIHKAITKINPNHVLLLIDANGGTAI